MQSLKAPLLLAVWSSYIVTMTPPVAHSKRAEATNYEQRALLTKIIEKANRPLVLGQKVFVSCVLATEFLFAAADALEIKSVSRLLSRNVPGVHAFISPTFLVGLLLAIVGASIRVMCYRELGRFFTFELSLRDQHQLVSTGPYAVVRHPGYTGIILVAAGVVLCVVGPGSWWTEARVLQSALGKPIVLGGGCVLLIKFLVALRAGKEDEMLRKTFGVKWEQYAEKVRYRFIPGVF